MAAIDPTARVADGAVIGAGVTIGPYCVIGPHVVIGEGCQLLSHVNVTGHTTIGARTLIHPFASLGSAPQSVAYCGEPTRLAIGEDCIIREGVTMNVGTASGSGVTVVGKRGFFMTCAHVGHDCHVGDNVVFANAATLGGHTVIGDHVVLGGFAATHQFTRVGAHAMISGLTGLRGDLIPFGVAIGAEARLEGINVNGMKRRGFSRATIHNVRRAYRMLFFDEGTFAERRERVATELGDDESVVQIVAFLREGSRRPLCHPRGGAPEAA